MLNKQLVRRAIEEKNNFYLAVGSSFASGLFAIFQAACLAKVFDRVFLKSQGLSVVSPWLLLLCAAIVLRAFTSWLGERASRRAGARIKHELRQELLTSMMTTAPDDDNKAVGQKITLLTEGIEGLEGYFAKYLPQLALALFIPFTLLIVAFPFDWITALILLITAPLLPVFMILIGSWSEKMAQNQWNTLKTLSGHLYQVLQGLTTLKLLGRSKKQIEVIEKLSRNWENSTLRVLRIAFLSAFTLEFIVTISTAIIAVGLGIRLINGEIPFERAMFLLLLAPEFYGPLRMLGTQFHAGQQGSAAADDIFSAFSASSPTSPDIPPLSSISVYPHITVQPLPRIDFMNVSCGYAGQPEVLNNISFSIAPGEKVALVGKSGTGKSTIIKLLLGFLSPDCGTVSIDGLPISVDKEHCRNLIALVPQHPHIFSQSVRENIALGNPGVGLTEITRAAQLAQAHEFIQDLPEQYNTIIGQGGHGLSAGQLQRIAIARAFLSSAPILIFDEATAGLDQQNEAIIKESIHHLAKNRTTLIIAHRPAMLELTDRILVLDQGQIAESESIQWEEEL